MNTVITPILCTVAPPLHPRLIRRLPLMAILLGSAACAVQEDVEPEPSMSAPLTDISARSQSSAELNAVSPQVLAASPVQERLWKKYVASEYEKAIEYNAKEGYGIHLCDRAGGDCDFRIDYNRADTFTAPIISAGGTSQEKLQYYTSATVNSYVFVTMEVVEDTDPTTSAWTSVDVSTCNVIIEDANGVPLSTDVDYLWSSEYDGRPSGSVCGYSNANKSSDWLATTYKNASPQPQAVICACPPDQNGYSGCSIGKTDTPKFNFNLTFFGAQSVQYTVTVKCGPTTDLVYGYATITPISTTANSDGSTTNHCNEGATYPPAKIYTDIDGDGAYGTPTMATARGSICLPLPTRTTMLGGKVSFAAVGGDCDDTNPDINPFTLNDQTTCVSLTAREADSYSIWLERTLEESFSSQEANAAQIALEMEHAKAAKANAGLASSVISQSTQKVPYMTSAVGSNSSLPELMGNFDFNKDGFMDFAIAYPNATTSAGSLGGRIYIVAGGPSRRAGGFELDLANLGHDVNHDGMISLNTKGERAVWILEGGNACEAGKSMATGDFDDDGILDLAIGQPGCASPTVTVLFGDNPADSATLPFNSETNLFYSLSSLPSSIRSLSITSTSSGRFGQKLTAGDINADGKHELIVGANEEGGTYKDLAGNSHKNGKVYILSGAILAPLSSGVQYAITTLSPLYMEGANPTSTGGRGTIGAGAMVSLDFDGDGKKDLAMFAPKAEEGGKRYGQVVIYDGLSMAPQGIMKIGGYVTQPKLYWRSNTQNDLVEVELAVMPDVKESTEHAGEELVIGAKNETVGGEEDAGMVYVMFSRKWTTQTTFSLPGADNTLCTSDKIRCFSGGIYGSALTNMQLGSSVAAGFGPYISSAETDGRERWLVMSAHQYPNGTNSTGRVTLLATHPNVTWTPGLDGIGWEDTGWNTGMQDIVITDAYWFGYQVALIGDVDKEVRDGYSPQAPELFVNASYAVWTNTTDQSQESSDMGQVSYLFYGGRGKWSQ